MQARVLRMLAMTNSKKKNHDKFRLFLRLSLKLSQNLA